MSEHTLKNTTLPSVFTEMLQSFIVLGETKRLSASVEILNVSRQTIRRHINTLEQLKGTKLFSENNRHYQLTDDGKAALEGAKLLIKSSNAWVNDVSNSYKGLLSTSVEVSENSWLYSQRHRLNDLWEKAPTLIKEGFKRWVASCGLLDHEAMTAASPYMLTYRKYRDEWLLVGFGEKSAYATWISSPNIKSELGRKLDLGCKYDTLLDYTHKAYDEVTRTGGAWYEHMAMSIPLYKGGDPMPVQYQRLIVACKFADGCPAIVVFAARTDMSEIPVRPAHRHIPNMPEYLMDDDIVL